MPVAQPMAQWITSTLIFGTPMPLTANGIAIDIGGHAAPRLVDWNDDGVLDLLVAGGDGYVWLFRQAMPMNGTDFLPGERLTVAGKVIQVGTSYTGVAFADINGDGKPDLIVAGNDCRIRYYPNVGTRSVPAFESFTMIPGPHGDFVLPASVNGRIEIVDWDQDGLLDLLTGDFDGYITWYRNTGTAISPAFGAPGVCLTRRGVKLQECHNIHPRVLDINQDGRLDLAFGINWGYVKVLVNSTGPGAQNFLSEIALLHSTGKQLNIRDLIEDDTIPDFADVTGDGVIDLVSGGKNGKLFVLPGVSYVESFNQITSLMATHRNDLSSALGADDMLREKLFGLHRNLRSVATGQLPIRDRNNVREWYLDHITSYPQYLRHREFAPSVEAHTAFLAGQVWVNLFESIPDSPQHRRETADACGFNGTLRELLVDLGLLYLDAGCSTAKSQKALYDITASLPSELQLVDLVTHDDFLKLTSRSDIRVEARTAINVFSQVGEYTEGFPSEVPQALIDGFSVVVAHELNHNVEHAAGQMYPWFWARKFDLLKQASPPDLVFHDFRTTNFGLDWAATQARFRAAGHWDGTSANWEASYAAYWTTGPGAGFERHWLRNNLRFCIESPQEAFATLSNQYFASSDMMLQLAVSRWKEGIKAGINQFLFFADVYSLGSDETLFFRVDVAGSVTRSSVPLVRDACGHIRGIITSDFVYDFSLDEAGNVQELRHTRKKPSELSRSENRSISSRDSALS